MVKDGYKVTDIGVIPDDWVVAPLEEFFSFISYGFTNPMPTSNEGILMITAKDINHGKILFDSARRTTFEAYNSLLTKKSKPLENDILLTKDGTLGRLAIVDKKQICINQSIALIRPNQRVYPEFLKQLLESKYFQRKMLDDAGGSTIKHIYITIINKMLVYVPINIGEQKEIAKILNDTDELINSLQILIEKKENIKIATMQQLLTGKKRLKGFVEEWDEKTLGSITSIKTGKRNNQDKIINGIYPFFVRSQKIERINTYSYEGEAILIPGEGGIGLIYHYIEGKFDYHQRVYKISDFEKNIYGKFVYYLMKQNFYDHAIKNSVKATVDSLRLPTLQKFVLRIPPTKKEQKKIVNILVDMDNEIEKLKEKLKKIKLIKEAMMDELLTGKTRLI